MSRLVLGNGGWNAAFLLAVGAVAVAGLLLFLAASNASGDDAPARPSIPDTSPTPATTAPGTPTVTRTPSTPSPTPTATRRPRPSVTVAPVQPFGREVTAIPDPVLTAAIDEALGDDLEDFSVVVIRPADGRAALIEPDRVYYAASLYKLAVLYEAGLRLSRGDLFLDDRLTITDEELEQDLGTLQYLDLDDENSLLIIDALEAMVTFSDNSTAVALLHLFESWQVDRTLRGLGIEESSVNTTELPATARDMARLMDAIVAGEGLDPATHELLLGMLARQQVRSGIPRGLPDGVTSGNKTGTWEDITHDVAYVQGASGTYIIAVLSATNRDWDTIARVSEAVYRVMEAD